MDEAGLLNALLTQGTIVAVLGYLAFWFKQRLEKREEELSKFANEVIKLVAIYQAKFDEDHKKIDELTDNAKDIYRVVNELLKKLEK